MKQTKIYIPIIVSISLVIGIWLGKVLTKRAQQIPLIFDSNTENKASNKLEAFINFIDDSYVDTINLNELTELTIKELLAKLDPHSVYLPKESFKIANESLNGNFEGIGVAFRIKKDTIMIVSVITGGPSKKVGLMAGDRIVSVNDSNVAGVEIDNLKVMKLLKGQKGTKVKLGIKRKGIKKALNFNIIRDKIPLYTVYAPHMIDIKTGYVRITQFGKNTFNEFVKAVSPLTKQNMKHLIIDLRGNGGGLMQSAVNIVDQLIKKGQLIVYTEGVHRKKYTFYSQNKGLLSDLYLTILMDEASASASEILAGAVQDNDRGVIAGRRSFGKGLVQEQVAYQDGSAMRLTVARYFTPSGRCIQKPYTGDFEEYYTESYHRYYNGELFDSEKVDLPDSLKYKTLEMSRPVYGGGGIIPDLFVAIDTLGYTEELKQLIFSGNLITFCNDYVDKNRQKLKKKFSSAKVFYFNFSEYKELKSKMLRFVKDQKFEHLNQLKRLSKKSEKILKERMMLYIIKECWGDNAFYKAEVMIDTVVKKVLKIFNTKLDNQKTISPVYTLN